MNGRYRVLLADRRALPRELLTAYLGTLAFVASVESRADPVLALRALESKAFDIVIARCEPSGLDGLSLALEISQRRMATRVILMGHDDGAPALELLRVLHAGALAYLAPTDGLGELSLAIEAVLRNNIYVSEGVLGERRLAEVVHDAHMLPDSPFDRFSTRERQVLHLLGQGLTSPQIGRLLSISAHTVDAHRSSVMRKTGGHSTTDLIRWTHAAEVHGSGLPGAWPQAL